ncbi:chloramphenicol acetyltransferase [Flavobacterium sp. 316]|nr:chloramphenicol acetyltransferase [Flavobacterium sp. 316]
MLKKICSKILIKLVPQLSLIIRDKVGLHWIENLEQNVERDVITQFHSPYTLIDCKIGKGTYISSNSKVSNTRIGRFCSIGPNFVCGWGIHPTEGVSTSPYFYSTAKQNGFTVATENLIEERKPIVIGNDVFIGANVTILDGITIGDGAVIGAGAVVSKNIPDYAIAVGCPIEIKKFRFSNEKIEELKNIKWWNWEDEDLKLINLYFFDIDKIIEIAKEK